MAKKRRTASKSKSRATKRRRSNPAKGVTTKAGTSLRMKGAPRAKVTWTKKGSEYQTGTVRTVKIMLAPERKGDVSGWSVTRIKSGVDSVERWRKELAGAKALGEAWVARYRKMKAPKVSRTAVAKEQAKNRVKAIRRGIQGAFEAHGSKPGQLPLSAPQSGRHQRRKTATEKLQTAMAAEKRAGKVQNPKRKNSKHRVRSPWGRAGRR